MTSIATLFDEGADDEPLHMISSSVNEAQLFDHDDGGDSADSLFRIMLSSHNNEDLNDAASYLEDFAACKSASALTDSQNSDFMRTMLADSGISAMSDDFDSMFLDETNRMTDLDLIRVDSGSFKEVEAHQTNDADNKKRVPSRRRRSSLSTSPRKKRTQVLREVDFDPAPSASLTRSLTRDINPRPQRHVVCSEPEVVRSLSSPGLVSRVVSYEEALKNLAESIKRTEQSRQQLMKHRALIATPTQQQQQQQQPQQFVQQPSPQQQKPPQHVVSPAHQPFQQQQLQQQPGHIAAAEQQPSQDQCVADAPPVLSARPLFVKCHTELSDDRSSIQAAFFSGSRDTLTNGLEQSRIQLKAYMDQVMGNSQTF